MAQGNRRRLGDLLLEAGLLDESQLKTALNEQRKWGGRLGRTVVELGFATETTIGQALAEQLELPSIDLDASDLPKEAVTWLRLDLCEQFGVFPLALNRKARALSLATADPTNVEHLQAIEFATNLTVMPTVASPSAIERAIRKYYFGESVAAPEPKPEGFQLDVSLGSGEYSATDSGIVAPPAPAQTVELEPEQQLRREIMVLREKAEVLESMYDAQVKSMRTLLELLIESGLISREEYVAKLHTRIP